nr:KICSTOR complex protein C12orf66-like [Penaeus vannamei]
MCSILPWKCEVKEVAEMASTHQSDHEEMVLQALMLHFTNFNFDKAKDQAEKERDMSRGVGSSMWQSLLTCIAQLAIAEKLYMNLSFLTSKGFLRKESSVRANFESLSIEFGELEKRNFETSNIRGSNARCSNAKTSNGNNAGNETANPGSPGSPGSLGNPGNLGNPGSPVSDGLLEHICSHLVLFTKARLQMIAFYERMVGSSMDRLMNFDELLAHVTDISMNNSRNFHHPLLTPLKTSFTYECDILMHLLRSQIEMQFWRFFPSLLHLHDAHTKLNTWHAVVQSKETKKYGFGSNFLKSSPLPPYISGVASKSSFCLKNPEFQRRSDAASVCLVFEAAGVEDYQGAGYHHPQESLSPPKGLDSYPAIFPILL